VHTCTCNQASDVEFIDEATKPGNLVHLRNCGIWARDPRFCSDLAGVTQSVCVQEVKGLAMVLERTPYPLAIELAALASQRGILSLQPWLQVLIPLHITAMAMR
jgi:CCR4-NOT transcription complex subunit 1 HEAT repeat